MGESEEDRNLVTLKGELTLTPEFEEVVIEPGIETGNIETADITAINTSQDSKESEMKLKGRRKNSNLPLIENNITDSSATNSATNLTTIQSYGGISTNFINVTNTTENRNYDYEDDTNYTAIDSYKHQTFPPSSPTSKGKRGSTKDPYSYDPLSRNDSDNDSIYKNGKDSQFAQEIPKLRRPPTSQKISMHGGGGDELDIEFEGFVENRFGGFLFRIAELLTAGIIFLLGRWIPSFRARFSLLSSSLAKATYIKVKNQFDETEYLKVEELIFDGPYRLLFSPYEPTGNVIDDLTTFNEKVFLPYADTVLNKIRLFKYRYHTLLLDPASGLFHQLSEWTDERWANPSLYHSGLDSKMLQERQVIFDKNEIEIKVKTIPQLLVAEVLHPFYIFQVFSIVLWCFEEYYIYAASIFIISGFSIVSTLIQTRNNWRQIKEMVHYSADVRVYRQKRWVTIPSYDMVPGDLYEVSDPTFTTFPCDSVLLQGDCIVGEGMLTGESIPVSKTAFTDFSRIEELNAGMNGSINQLDHHFTKSILFCGTQVIRVRGGSIPADVHPERERDRRSVALVLRTGFSSFKGSLIRSILFPRPNFFKFYRDSFYFIGVMAVIGLIGFVLTVIKLKSLGLQTYLIVIRALDLITIVVPPALPATMTVGMVFALSRLKQAGVYCIAPSRINVGGKIDITVFDKTGTLTEEGLDVLGAQITTDSTFSELQEDILLLPDHFSGGLSLKHCLATCHSIKLVDGELLGDPLDLKMFEATQWTLEEGGATHSSTPSADTRGGSVQLIPSMVRPPGQSRLSVDEIIGAAGQKVDELGFLELAILRSFEFVPALRRMSVVVKRFRSETTEVYVKGAPEIIAGLCDPSTIPSDYVDRLHFYTMSGYRVIACAGKSVNNLSWVKVQKAERVDIESGLSFLGFIIFENKLKPGTMPAIEILKKANINQLMCTGDNHLTAISVARECGMLDAEAIVFAPKLEGGRVIWPSVNHLEILGSQHQLLYLNETTLGLPTPFSNHKYEIVLTGETFRTLVDDGNYNLINRMLVKAKVYARMAPDDKQELVELLKGIDHTVAFCGDGANDCGALRAADVGISLSDAEASVAAPFTSRTADISCVPYLIREGRTALVTSFACFKYMGLYSIIQFSTIIILYEYGSNLGDYQFLLFDLFLIMPLAVAMGYTMPHDKLYHKPPTASLVSGRMLVSFIGQCGLQLIFQIGTFMYLISQDWFEEPEYNPDEKNINNMVNTTLFLLSSYLYMWGALVFSVGYPYRKSLYTNYHFVGTLLVLFAYLLWQNLGPAQWISDLMELVEIPTQFRCVILGLAAAHLASAYLYERYLVTPVAYCLKLLKHILFLPYNYVTGQGAIKLHGFDENKTKKFKAVANTMKYESINTA